MTTRVPSCLERLLLAARTARHLSVSQLVYWPLRRVQQRIVRAPAVVPMRASQADVQRIRDCLLRWECPDDAGAITRADRIRSGVFTFLNHSEVFGEVDWRTRHVSHLWNYHLHYFEYAVDLAWAHHRTGDQHYADAFARLARSWMTQCVPGEGDGWDPYVISVRVPAWIYAVALMEQALPSDLRDALWQSIGAQAAFLERRLEHHLRANHLQRNYRALALAGTALDGAPADRWRRTGLNGLWRELPEQVLPDGGHFERSPMYHVAALCDFLECADIGRVTGAPAPVAALERLRAMSTAVFVLARPDDDLHFFNDSANGIALPASYAIRLATAVLGQRPQSPSPLTLPITGYFGFADAASGERILVDGGPPGPGYQPGHAHCDLLSFELDLGGRRVIVDSGTSGYEGDPLRGFQRSTRAHNTLSIDGLDQSELWGTFRVARRARVLEASSKIDGTNWHFFGAYHPYHSSSTTHERRIRRLAPGKWSIVDRVTGTTGSRLELFLHFHPDYHLRRDGDRFLATCADGPPLEVAVSGVDSTTLARGQRDPVLGWYAQEFGRAEPCTTLVATARAGDQREIVTTIRVVGSS